MSKFYNEFVVPLQGQQINARIKAKPMNRFFNVSNNLTGGIPGVPGLGLVPPAPVPLPVPVILAPGGPLPVAVAPVPPAAVPLAPAPVAATAAAVAPLKNGFAPSVASATPPPHESAPAGATNAPAQQPSQQPAQQPHIPAQQQQPRFLFAVNSLPGAPYGGPGQVQLYFPHASPFYTPTLPVSQEADC